MDVENEFPVDENHQFLGRTTIYTSREKSEINAKTIPDIINGAMYRHLKNYSETIYLKNYFLGDHPISDREKIVREDINNKLVINQAQSIVRNGVGYFLGEPIQFTAKVEEDADSIQLLNAYMDTEDKSCEDMSIGNDCSICGRGFRLIATDNPEEVDDAPFELPTLDPECTEVIYSSRAGHKPLLAFTHSPILDDEGNQTGTLYVVYDDTYKYIYSTDGDLGAEIESGDLQGSPVPHFLGDVPIVEYPNNEWRLGDFEIVITILDEIDKLNSDRANDIEQIVNAILVFQGIHLRTSDEKDDGSASDSDLLKETMTLEIPSSVGKDPKVYYVSSNLDQSQAEVFQQTLMDYVYAITGIPDRKDRSNGGGDTGDAVYLRDGYQALEVVARVKERNFRKSERRALKMVCTILKVFDNVDLKPIDIDIKFIRNRTDNLLNKSQAFSNLMSTKEISPTDGIGLIGITNDPKGMAQRGETYWESKAATAVAQASNQATGKVVNPDDTTDGEA